MRPPYVLRHFPFAGFGTSMSVPSDEYSASLPLSAWLIAVNLMKRGLAVPIFSSVMAPPGTSEKGVRSGGGVSLAAATSVLT